MLSIQTSFTFPLAAVKPLEHLAEYRTFCIDATVRALGRSRVKRCSPIDGAELEPTGRIDGLQYGRCRLTGSLFLEDVSDPGSWATLLQEVSRQRRDPSVFHADLLEARTAHVHRPKLDWIKQTLRLQRMQQPRVIEVATPPSDFSSLLYGTGTFDHVVTLSEAELIDGVEWASNGNGPAQAAILLEALDRVADPASLAHAMAARLERGGLLFVTAQVASGFDIEVLGLRDLYLYPPDRTNCFTLTGLERLLRAAGFEILELSTPGVLDVEVVAAHLRSDPGLPLGGFERRLLAESAEVRRQFQTFLQQQRMSSFARVVGVKQ